MTVIALSGKVVSGVTPAAISMLMIYMKTRKAV